MPILRRINGELVLVSGGADGESKPIKAVYDETTALYSHAVDDIIYTNSHFYKATSAIAVGDTIAVGTNITADTGLAIDTPIYVSNLPNS